ncbi:MAG: GNAT family N-acetyltransferase [Deltaproteobacteria bacterium]|nr:GNAT family N-acetyltransferase [Deltaproteobacteria bacterium]
MSDYDWKTRWADKVLPVERAMKLLHSGWRVLLGSGAAEPAHLVEAMVEHGTHLADVEVYHLLTLGEAPYTRVGLEDRFRHTAFFIGENVREAVQSGRADFMSVFLSEIPELIRSRRVPMDAALVAVSPPDRHGYMSLGVSVDVVRSAVDTASVVIAEVNPQMPRTYGDSFVHVDRVAALVPVDRPIFERLAEPIGSVERAIGEHVARLVPDGATLQMGIGKIPDAVLAALDHRRDLGIHTEMFSDVVMRLAQLGVVNGRRKTLLPGKIVSSFFMGTRALYDWAHENPAIEMRPSEWTNDPFVIARNDNMVAVNSALAVDLTGQVAADTIGGRFFSGIGGQVDFIRGSKRSRGGKPVIALPSTAKNGTLSRITPALEAGAGVVTSRGDVHYVVTEHGVADLWGKNVRQRALALIEIAHPDFRVELLAAAKARRYCFPNQVAPRGSYPWAEARTEKLRDGTDVLVRPVRLSDDETLQDLFYRLSDESTYRRFLSYKRSHPMEEIQRLCDLDFEHAMALVAVIGGDAREEIVGMVRYDLDPATRFGDVAFVVRDDYQRRGLGTVLMRRISELGRARGLRGFTADVLAHNHAMIAVFQRSGLKVKGQLDEGTYTLTMTFDTTPSLPPPPPPSRA